MTLVVARPVIEHEPSATGMEREALFALDLLLSAIVLAREPAPPPPPPSLTALVSLLSRRCGKLAASDR